MAIILEGPDAAGKTTLARILRDQFGLEHLANGGAPTDDFQLFNYCDNQLKACERRNVIIDRISPISHPVYHPEYVDNKVLKGYLHSMLNRPYTIVVYCRPPLEALMRPEKHEWKDYDTEEHKQKVLNNLQAFIESYDNIFRRIPHLAYDYTDESDYVPELIAMLAASVDSDEILTKLRDFHTVKC